MKKAKNIANILFWTTLISPMFSFALVSVIGEANIFGVLGIIRYSWIMWLFIPMGVLSILIGKKLKQSKQNYKKNYIISFICLPLIIIFGSYRFVFNDILYDVDKVAIIEEKTNLELPNKVKIATKELDLYNVSYLKITDQEDKKIFEYELEANTLWKTELNSKIKSLLPLDIQYEVKNFDYFVFCNLTNNEYNVYPLNGEYKCIFIAYDYEMHRLIILDDFKINLN